MKKLIGIVLLLTLVFGGASLADTSTQLAGDDDPGVGGTSVDPTTEYYEQV